MKLDFSRKGLLGITTDEDFDAFHLEPLGELVLNGVEKTVREIDVVNLAGLLAVEMGVLLEVRTETGGLAFDMNLPHEATLHEGIETIIDSGQGDARHIKTCPEKNLVSRGVVTLVHEDVEDVLALPSVSHAITSDGVL